METTHREGKPTSIIWSGREEIRPVIYYHTLVKRWLALENIPCKNTLLAISSRWEEGRALAAPCPLSARSAGQQLMVKSPATVSFPLRWLHGASAGIVQVTWVPVHRRELGELHLSPNWLQIRVQVVVPTNNDH